MTNAQSQMSNRYDIHQRIFVFVIRVIKFLNKLPKTPTNLIFIAQCTRSVASMGANDQEADGAVTTKDFLHGFTIVRKESKETVFWLRVIEQVNNQSYLKDAKELTQEGSEIVAIISTIIKNTLQSKSA